MQVFIQFYCLKRKVSPFILIRRANVNVRNVRCFFNVQKAKKGKKRKHLNDGIVCLILSIKLKTENLQNQINKRSNCMNIKILKQVDYSIFNVCFLLYFHFKHKFLIFYITQVISSNSPLISVYLFSIQISITNILDCFFFFFHVQF